MRSTFMFGVCAAGLIAGAGAASADVVLDWNQIYIQSIREAGGPPCPNSRGGPMLFTTIYDAVNAVDLAETGVGYTPYSFKGAALPGTNRDVAAAKAARDVLVTQYPQFTAQYDAHLASQLAAIPDGAGKTQGLALGAAVAANCITTRDTDGWDNPTVYVPGGNAGDWRPDAAQGPNVPGFSPMWGTNTTWAIPSGDYFRHELVRPDRPFGFDSMESLVKSSAYAAQVNDVKAFGAANSLVRTQAQTDIAWFWANDRDGTSKPPGQMFDITQRISEQQNLSTSENARLFALLGMALGDACIAGWDAKYQTDIDLWRPTDAIRETQDDGNASTTPDKDWLPLNDFQPPFPSYISGHSTFGGAWAAIMQGFFGTDEMTFTATTDEPMYTGPAVRTYHRFSDAGFEDAISRVYLGVHFRWDCEDGYFMGDMVGDYIAANMLRPIPTPGAGLVFALGAAGLGLRRRRA